MFPNGFFPSGFFPHGFFPALFAASSKQSNYAQIMTAVRNQLISFGVFTSNQVALSLWEEPFPAIGSPFAYIYPDAGWANEYQVAGGGRYFTGQSTVFEVRIFLFNQVDEAYQDTRKIYGGMDIVEAVINSLQMFFPLSVGGGTLTEEPIRLAGVARPIRYRTTGEWIAIRIPFEVNYVYLLNTSTDV